MKTCAHWQDCGVSTGGRCTLYNRTQSFGVCQACKANTTTGDWITRALKRTRMGDKVAAVTSAVGIKPCGGCKKRQAKLNGEP